MEIKVIPVKPEIRFSQNFSLAKKSAASKTDGWDDLYIYILAGIGLAAMACIAYVIVENTNHNFYKIQKK
jgi:hypothetical protein